MRVAKSLVGWLVMWRDGEGWENVAGFYSQASALAEFRLRCALYSGVLMRPVYSYDNPLMVPWSVRECVRAFERCGFKVRPPVDARR